MQKSYLTREGYEKLKKELEYLKEKKKPEISERIKVAREHGDLKENAEYHAAKEILALTMMKIRDLSLQLSNAEIIDESGIDSDKVYVGAKVRVKDLEDDEEETYILVGSYEVDPLEGKISVDSPIAQGLIGHKAGEIVEIKIPAGSIKYKIIEITR